MYCAEWADNNGKTSNIILPAAAVFTPEMKKDLLGGVAVLKGEARTISIDPTGEQVQTTPTTLTVIPYYAWSHRGNREMTVWFPSKVTKVSLVTR